MELGWDVLCWVWVGSRVVEWCGRVLNLRRGCVVGLSGGVVL